ncbi:MAG: hypothetical protein VZQ47_00385 [Treponema sp.]|nr:hypothetical protein [Treponema sp.]MEE3433999.1 hypothetical protein [Treponema sp.]
MGDASSFYDGQRFEADGTNGGPSGGQASAQVSDCLTVCVSLPNLPTLSGNAPVPKNIAQNISKSAFPNIGDAYAADSGYSFEAMLENASAYYATTGKYNSITGTCDFAFPGAKSASSESYYIIVKLYYTDDSATPAEKKLVARGGQSVSVASGASSFEASVILAPCLGSDTNPAPNGSLELPIKFSDTSVAKVRLKLLDSGDNDKTTDYLVGLSGTDLPLSGGAGTIRSKDSGLPPGAYTLLMEFLNTSGQKVGFRTETLNIYPTMQTRLWWTKDGMGSASTALNVTKFDQREFWVRGTGGDFYTNVYTAETATALDTNVGSFAFPLKTIQEAVDRIKAAGDTTSQYTVYIDGKIECDPDADYSAQNDACVNIACDRMITIKGWSGANIDIIDANKSSAKNARVFYIDSSKKIILQKITVTGGYLSATSPATAYGGGLYISGATTEVELEDCVIKENGAQNQGAGAYIASGAKLTMNGSGSAINKNMLLATTCSASDTYEKKVCGGGVYVAQSATFLMNAGTIRENGAVYPSNPGLISGCAAYVCGNFTMKGGTISSNGIRLATSSPIEYSRNVEVTCPGTFDLYDGSITDDMDLLPCNNGSGVCVYAFSSISPVSSGAVTFNMFGGTITGLKSRGGGGVYLAARGVGLSCKFNMSGGSIIGNEARDNGNSYTGQGGGVYVGDNSVFNFTGGTISGNTATYSSSVSGSGRGGGIYIASSSAKCFISGSATIGQSLASTSSCATSADGSHSNMAAQGGGIYNAGELYLGYTDDSTPAEWTGSVCYNYASSDGGGILSSGSSSLVKMNAGSVAYNLCSDGSGTTGGGGGVAVQNSSAFTMSGGTVSYNQTNNKVGGGIYVDSGATLTLNGTAEVSSNKTSPDGTGPMGGAGLFAYRASITMEGNAVVKDNLCKACGGGVYLFESENASSYASLAMSGNAKILENTSSDGLGGAVYVTQRCSFSMQGAATIPAGVAGTTGAGKNDVYLDENTSVAVPAAITSTATPVATITPKSPYAVDTIVLTGAALTAAECAKFAVTQPAGEEFPWAIKYDSATAKGVLKQPRFVIYVASTTAVPAGSEYAGDDYSGNGSRARPYATLYKAATTFSSNPEPSGTADEPIFENKIYVLSDLTYTHGAGADYGTACRFEVVGCKDGTVGNNVKLIFNTPDEDDCGFYVAPTHKIKFTNIDITQTDTTTPNDYAAINVDTNASNSGEVWLEDSSIKGMYAKKCSAIAAKGDVHLKNVEISDNKTVAATGGSMTFGPAINSSTGTVSVLGKVVVQNNTVELDDGAGGKVYKDQNLWIGENSGTPVFHPIKIAGVLDGESKIGVTLFDNSEVFTDNYKDAGNTAEPSTYFTSDDGMNVAWNTAVASTQKEAKLVPPTTLYVRLGGSDLIGNGSSLLPFATIQKALDKINGLNNASADYTIKVEGVLAAAQHAAADDALKAATLTIKGDSAATSVVSGGLSESSEPILWLSEVTIPVTIENIGFISGKNSDSTSGGGAILAESCANITIKDSAFTSCSAKNGGAIYLDGGTLTLSNTSFTGNSSGYNGGAIFVKTGTLEMNSGTIAANTATASGGGVSVGSGGTFIMSGGKISGNSAGVTGGGINNSGVVCIYGDAVIGDSSASGTATSETDSSNKADYNGGGICNLGKLALGYKTWTSSATAPSNPQTLDGGVYYNYAQAGGGIFNANSSTLYIASGNISKNMAASTSGNDGGGGIDSYGASAKLYMTGGTVSQNKSTHFGGGVLVYSGAAELTGVTISGNTASSNGGGFACVGGTVTMNSGTIGGLGAGNIGAGGAGVYLKKDDAAGIPVFTMKGGKVTYNTVASGGSGGGFMNQYGTLNIQGSAKISNNDGGSSGGGILTLGTTNMTGGTISANTAHNGGGVFVFQNDFAMSDGTISGNTATVNPSAADPSETGHGGGVYVNNLADGATTYLGDFKLSGAAYIPLGTGNDVYLQNSITIEGDLTHAAPAATITPSVYSSGTIVLTNGTGTVADNYGKFAVADDSSGGKWTVNSSGCLAQVGSSGGSITIHTPEGDLKLAASATTIATSAIDTTVTISATDASGSAITSGLTWNGITVYYGADEVDSGSGNSYTFLKAFPKGTYTLAVSVTYKGTTYSDSFTITKTVD